MHKTTNNYKTPRSMYNSKNNRPPPSHHQQLHYTVIKIPKNPQSPINFFARTRKSIPDCATRAWIPLFSSRRTAWMFSPGTAYYEQIEIQQLRHWPGFLGARIHMHAWHALHVYAGEWSSVRLNLNSILENDQSRRAFDHSTFVFHGFN